jgi:hypothetical protein
MKTPLGKCPVGLDQNNGLLNSLILDIKERNPTISERHLPENANPYYEPINIPMTNDYCDPYDDGYRL